MKDLPVRIKFTRRTAISEKPHDVFLLLSNVMNKKPTKLASCRLIVVNVVFIKLCIKLYVLVRFTEKTSI